MSIGSTIVSIETDMTAPTNKLRLSIAVSQELLDEAKKYEINVSRAARNGIEAAIEREKKIRKLLEEEETECTQ